MSFHPLSSALLCLVAFQTLQEKSTVPDPVSEVANLKYSKAGSVSSTQLQTLSNVALVPELTDAFAPGQNAVATFKNPILTRGVRGISLFRQSSPGVLLVVVGKVEGGKFSPSGLGTGAIIDNRGYIVTNWHVINGFEQALVFFKPPGNPEPRDEYALVANVVAQNRTKDLALLKLVETPPVLTVLPLKESNSIDVAEDVHIIGHPHGNFWSYSTGVISQYRSGYSWSYEDGSTHLANVIQMQTAINPGNSGGPVLNDAGHILGLVAMSKEGQNLDYAISVDEIRTFLGTWLPTRTRGISKTSFATNSSDMSISEATDSKGNHVLKTSKDGNEIYLVESGRQWQAFVQKGEGPLFQIVPEGDKWRIKGSDGKRLIATLLYGKLASLRRE